MKKIININLASRLIPIEDSAYEILRQYLDSLKRYFAREEGADEIVGDIESRIAELFQDKLKKGAHCITDEDVLAMKAAMGTPEQFDGATETESAQQDTTKDSILNDVRPRKRLYRDPEGKVLGGVCGGLGAYLNVDPVVFRIIFALLAIGGFGTGVLIYFILWVATPEANTATEKLEMRGERIDVNNIKATVQDEIQAMKGHLKSVGDDVRNFSQGRGRQVGSDIERFVRSLTEVFVKVVVVLSKGFFYFITAIILLSLFGAGVSIAVASPVLFPLKDLLLAGSLQNMLFWPALILIIGIPIVGITIFLIRKLAGVKETNRYVGYTLSFLFFTGVVLSLLVIASVAKDFKTRYPVKEKIALMQPSNGKLVIKQSENLIEMDDVGFFDGGLRMTEDTVIIEDVQVKMEKSPNDSFQVEIQRSSRGRTVAQARTLAHEISYQISQQDSILYLPAGFSIPRDSKYRNQRLIVVIRVPVGKKVDIDPQVRHHYHFRDWDSDSWDYDNEDDVTELKMTTDGLDNIKIEKRSRNTENTDSLRDNYRYEDRKKKSTTPVNESSSSTDSSKKVELGISGVLYGLYHLTNS